ncbi:hypothetical protein QEW_1151 [Clostridioides difficile CD160]|nr:hypothetical protein QEW_1151 [Clostridioides difficile CD160]
MNIKKNTLDIFELLCIVKINRLLLEKGEIFNLFIIRL